MATHKEKWSAVRNLDLEKIRLKWLIDYKNSLRIWQFCKKKNAETYAMQLQHEYRQFLFLCAVNPGKVIVPWSNDSGTCICCILRSMHLIVTRFLVVF